MTRDERSRLAVATVWCFGGGLCWGVLATQWGYPWAGWVGAGLVLVAMVWERQRP